AAGKYDPPLKINERACSASWAFVPAYRKPCAPTLNAERISSRLSLSDRITSGASAARALSPLIRFRCLWSATDAPPTLKMIMLQLVSASIHLSASSGVSDARRNFVVPDRRSRRATRPKLRKGNESTIKIVDSSGESIIFPPPLPQRLPHALRKCPIDNNSQLKKSAVTELAHVCDGLTRQLPSSVDNP